jgi:hypothetical protein
VQFVDEMHGEGRYILLVGTKGRKRDGEQVETVKQVRAEPSFLNHTSKALVGGRDKANIYANRLRITESLKIVAPESQRGKS